VAGGQARLLEGEAVKTILFVLVLCFTAPMAEASWILWEQDSHNGVMMMSLPQFHRVSPHSTEKACKSAMRKQVDLYKHYDFPSWSVHRQAKENGISSVYISYMTVEQFEQYQKELKTHTDELFGQSGMGTSFVIYWECWPGDVDLNQRECWRQP
jgi:hypothetical protein